jgi:hypothetical protein
VIRRISNWYDSEAVRFFFREKFPRHGAAETLPMPMLMLLGLTSAFLATIDLSLLYYGFIASLLFFTAVAWGFLEALHYLYDRT